MQRIKLFIQFIIICVLLTSVAMAETYRYFGPITTSQNYFINTQAGDAKYFDIVYNTETKELRFVVNFAPVNGVLPDGFDLVINDGPYPKTFSGELATFYFDARNLANPALSVYAYNGTPAINSWKTAGVGYGADKILSNRAAAGSAKNPNGWIKQLIAVNENNGSRSLGFVLNATIINSHTPLFPNPNPMVTWKGSIVLANLGMWFHPAVISNATYGSDGFLSAWAYSIFGSYDSFLPPITTVKEDPVCTYTFVSPKVEIGKPFLFTITGDDKQKDSLKVNYSGLPVGATITPADGSFGASPRAVNFNWTPQTVNAGQSYTIGVLFTDPHGATRSCPLTFNVPANKAPVCSASPTNAGYQNLSCNSSTTSVKLDGSATYDPELGTVGLSYAWTSNCLGAVFNNPNSVSPTLTFKSEDANGVPVSCTATLHVTDGKALTSCGATVSVSACTRDCAGTISGSATFDQCGVCNGNGTSCLDCRGTPNGASIKDVCGVCAGDGNSCACSESSIRDLLFELDSNAKQQAKLAIRAAKRLANVSQDDESVDDLVVAVSKQANSLYMDNWTQTWSLQQIIYTCPANNPQSCATVSNQSTISSYNANADSLYKLTLQVLREVKQRNKKAEFKNLSKYRKKAKLLYNDSLKGSSSVPTSFQSCN